MRADQPELGIVRILYFGVERALCWKKESWEIRGSLFQACVLDR